MFVYRGNRNSLLQYAGLNENVAFKIIKYILLVTSLILLLIYVVLYVVFMLFAAKFVEQYQTDTKATDRDEYVYKAKWMVSAGFVYVLLLQLLLIYAIYRELYRLINCFAILSLLLAIYVPFSELQFFSFGHILIASLHSLLLFYYAYRIRRVRMANRLYIANRNPQDGLIYTNYGAPPLTYGHSKGMRYNRNAAFIAPNSAYPNPNAMYDTSYYGAKFPVNHPNANPMYANQINYVDASGYTSTGNTLATTTTALYPVQPQMNASISGQPLAGHAQYQPHAVYNASLTYPNANVTNATNVSMNALPVYQQVQTSGHVQPHVYSNTYPTVVQSAPPLISNTNYQHVAPSSSSNLNSLDRTNPYSSRTLSRQTAQIPIVSNYQRNYYDSGGYASANSNLNALAAPRSWNVNVNPVSEYVHPGSVMSTSGNPLITSANRTNDPIYVSRHDSNPMYQSAANTYLPTNRRTNAYHR